MRAKILHAIISCILILVSFFLGSQFTKNNLEQEYQKRRQVERQIFLTQSGKNLDIQKADENLQIYLNGKLLQTK